MKLRVLIGFAVALGALACVPKGTTIYVLRHAEKSNDDPRDPSLSPEGLERAQALATAIPPARVDAVYATEFLRTQQTVFPLAEKARLVPEVYSSKDPSKLLRQVKEKHQDQTVVVCGHSNTVGEILAGLGVRERVSLSESDYGDLYVVRIVDGLATLERKRFGR